MESLTYWNEENRCFLQSSCKINHQVKDFLCRDVEIRSLAQTVENQPKFFANSMKVHIDLKPCEYFVILQIHLVSAREENATAGTPLREMIGPEHVSLAPLCG